MISDALTVLPSDDVFVGLDTLDEQIVDDDTVVVTTPPSSTFDNTPLLPRTNVRHRPAPLATDELPPHVEANLAMHEAYEHESGAPVILSTLRRVTRRYIVRQRWHDRVQVSLAIPRMLARRAHGGRRARARARPAARRGPPSRSSDDSELDPARPDPRGPHELLVREEPCGCVRMWCTWGHSPEEILDALGQGWTLDDLLCNEHRNAS